MPGSGHVGGGRAHGAAEAEAPTTAALLRWNLKPGQGEASGYNDAQAPEALDYILDGLESAFADGYTDEQWQSIAEHLGENVHNGLT